MVKKIFGTLALIAATAYGLDLSITAIAGGLEPKHGMKAILIVAFLSYGIKALKPAPQNESQ